MGLVLYFLVSLFLAFLYAILIYKICSFWIDQREQTIPDDFLPKEKLSVVIAARNEADNIKSCIESILENNYPKGLMELFIVDDHSTDNTWDVINSIEDIRLKPIKLEGNQTGKKEALSLAISKSSGEIIITTDADCIVQKDWLRSFAYQYTFEEKNLVTAAVCFDSSENRLSRFQILDLCGIMAITAYGILNQKFYLANGANMSYRKSSFHNVNGFENNKQFASGDDVFLIQEMAKTKPTQVSFLKSKDAIVYTKPESNFKSLYAQRKRWATKSKGYSDRNLQLLLAFVFLFNLSIVFNLFIGPFLNGLFLFIGLFQLLIKGIMDFLFLKNLTTYFDRTDSLQSFISASILAVGNILFSGITAIFGRRYNWKDRALQ